MGFDSDDPPSEEGTGIEKDFVGGSGKGGK